jgi:hypothetical protein
MDSNTAEPNYRDLYFGLLYAQNQAIEALQQAHVQAEEVYIGFEPDGFESDEEMQ